MSRIQLANLQSTENSESFLIDLPSTEANAINGGFFFGKKRSGFSLFGGSHSSAPVSAPVAPAPTPVAPPEPAPAPPVVAHDPEPAAPAPVDPCVCTC